MCPDVEPTVKYTPESAQDQMLIFKKRADFITSTQLTARNLDSFADNALLDLIMLVEDAKIQCANDGVFDTNACGAEQDRQGLEHVGLNYDIIDATLDHIQNVGVYLNSLPDKISKVSTPSTSIFVPPDYIPTQITAGDGSFEKPAERIPKLQVLALLLKQEFAVDLSDPSQVSILKGSVDQGMIRKTGYDLIVVNLPSPDDSQEDESDKKIISRVILSCDEIGNTTFVLDPVAIAETQERTLDPPDLANMTKQQLKKLIEDFPTVGTVIDYSENYVDNLAEALKNPFGQVIALTSPQSPPTRVSTNILKPKALPAQDGEMSIRGMGKEWGVDAKTIQNAIKALKEEDSKKEGAVNFKVVLKRKFGSNITEAYTPEQVELIRQQLEKEGNFSEPAQDGEMSIWGMCKEWGVGKETIRSAIEDLRKEDSKEEDSDKFEVILKRKFGSNITEAYTPEQVELIRQRLEEQGNFSEPAQDGEMSIGGMSKEWGVNARTIQNAIKALKEEGSDKFKVILKRKFGTNITEAYTRDQQALILEHINKKR